MYNHSPLQGVATSGITVETMEVVVTVSACALVAVFIGALVMLIIVCRRQRESAGFIKKIETSREKQLIPPEEAEVELGEVRLHPDIEQILADEQWIGDATGLVPHCLAVLKICHMLTERLATLAMGSLTQGRTLQDIVEIARRISPRVDDVVHSMYPPLDARLLEARTAALVLAVAHLALVTRYGCSRGKSAHRFTWIDQALSDMEPHLSFLLPWSILVFCTCLPSELPQLHFISTAELEMLKIMAQNWCRMFVILVLREAALAQEVSCRIHNSQTSSNTLL